MARSYRRTNLSPLERGLSVAFGAFAASTALRQRRGVSAAILGAAGGLLIYRGVTGRSALYRRLGISDSEVGRTVSACSQVTVQVPAAEAYSRLRDLSDMARFSKYLESAHELTGERWHVRFRTPLDGTYELVLRRTADVDGRRLAWVSAGEESLPAALELRFTEGNSGTEIHADAWLVPPVPALVSNLIARAERSRPLRRAGVGPSQLLEQELRRLRQLLEAGEIATVDGQSAGGRRGRRTLRRLESGRRVAGMTR